MHTHNLIYLEFWKFANSSVFVSFYSNIIGPTNKYCLSQFPLEVRNPTKDVTLQQNTKTGYQI